MAFGIGKYTKRGIKHVVVRAHHPSAFNDDLASRDLQAIQHLFDGRNVAVIGNARSLLVQGLGTEIDGHDTIIRMNHGFVSEPDHQGSRTDVLCVAARWQTAEEVARFGAPAVLFTARNRLHLHLSICRRVRPLYFAPQRFHDDLERETGLARPSTGLIVTRMVETLFSPSRVTLFGFDWKASGTFYLPEEAPNSPHEWGRERQILAEWQASEPMRRAIQVQ